MEDTVETMKHHLIIVIDLQVFNYEEFFTYVNQIKAVIHSRPFIPIADGLVDLSAITSGHMLTGIFLKRVHEQNYINKNVILTSMGQSLVITDVYNFLNMF